jgi:BirA family transcriptional regulator, biotin operon repressor / biotin---[acetyl-CoA-carboxylase] ligase
MINRFDPPMSTSIRTSSIIDIQMPPPSDIAEALALAGSRLGTFERRLSWHEEVGSTNDVAIAAAEEGAAEGVVIAANAQLSGRGRVGRSWSSPAGAGLYVSVVLRPAREALPLVTIAAGVAIAEGIHAATGLLASVKWPNDVNLGSRKLAGILAEGGSSNAAVDYVIVGFGVNLRPATYSADVAARATCIEIELGRAVDRGLVLAECLSALSTRYHMLQSGAAADVVAAWRARAASNMGRAVEWDTDGGSRRGIAHDIDATGALLIRADDQIVRVISGEVRWLP